MGVILIVTIAASSCKQLIELPGNPPTKITQEQQFSDSMTAMTAVAGVYNYPENGPLGSFKFNDGMLSWTTALSADELLSTTNSSEVRAFYNYSLLPNNSNINMLWSAPYAGLYSVNTILEEVPRSSGLSSTFKKQIVAEMKVMRALYYFHQVNLFGPVPLVLSSDYKTTAILPRSSEDKVYEQILKDLDEAKADLTIAYPSASKVRPNYYTALSLLAKVHLYLNNWQAAFDAADSVIRSEMYRLDADLNNVFLAESEEAIWHLPANVDRFVVREAQNYVPYFGSTPSYILTESLLNAFEPADLRKENWVDAAIVPGSPLSYFPNKYKNPTPNNAATKEYYIIFRLAELYLIRAEAQLHLGDIPGAIEDLNELRARARGAASVDEPNPLPALETSISAPAAFTALMKERQTELFTEWGNRWFDLKRTGLAETVLKPVKPSWQATAELFPVPQEQRKRNPFLDQNPGYQ